MSVAAGIQQVKSVTAWRRTRRAKAAQLASSQQAPKRAERWQLKKTFQVFVEIARIKATRRCNNHREKSSNSFQLNLQLSEREIAR